MFSQTFGRFLVEQKIISAEQLSTILENQSKVMVKLGLIAVSEKLLSQEQADKINKRQSLEDKRFGELAVEMGFLTESQVSRLLQLQGNPYLTFAQAAAESEIMTLDEIENAMNLYQRENGFTTTDMEDFKSGDIDRMLSLYVRNDNRMASELAGVAVRTIVRLIDSEIAIDHAYEADGYEFENLAFQNVEGEHAMMLGLAGEGGNLLAIAETFAKEEFAEMDLFAFDSVCEFINCVNGLYASALSRRGVMEDMVPPMYYQSGNIRAKEKFLILPIYVKSRKIRIVIAIDAEVKIEA